MFSLAKRRHRIRTSLGDKIFTVLNYIFLAFCALVCIFPIFYVLSYSLTPYSDYLADPLRLIPARITFQAYKDVVDFPLIWSGYYSTLFITIVGTLLNVTMLVITGYPLTKKHLKGRNFIMLMITFTMFFSGGMIPGYLLIRNLHLLNTYWSLILPGACSAYNLILMRNFIAAIPASLEEAAYIDGANELTILWRVIVPLCKPALATFTLFSAVGHWNSYFSSILYISDRKKWPLMLIVRELVANSGTDMIKQSSTLLMEEITQPFTLQMAVIIFTIVPILLVYPFVQKYFMKGMMVGSIKG